MSILFRRCHPPSKGREEARLPCNAMQPDFLMLLQGVLIGTGDVVILSWCVGREEHDGTPTDCFLVYAASQPGLRGQKHVRRWRHFRLFSLLLLRGKVILALIVKSDNKMTWYCNYI